MFSFNILVPKFEDVYLLSVGDETRLDMGKTLHSNSAAYDQGQYYIRQACLFQHLRQLQSHLSYPIEDWRLLNG